MLFVLGGWWLETPVLDGGGQVLARQAGARKAWPASHDDEQRLCNIVHELAIAASMKPPQAMVLPREDRINAFAAGWDEDDAIVAVPQGALECLSRDEPQGLLAHEFSHLREGDTRLNMRLAGMVCGLEMIFSLGQRMCEANENGSRSFLALPGFAIMGTGSLGWLAGRALKAAVSRQREFLSDARTVQFTRSKDGLVGVLRKVAGERASAGRRPGGRTPHLHPAVHHMLLVSNAAPTRWFASHPPLAERIRRIYGRSMPVLPARHDEAVTRPDALF
ncbi:Zn-dependent protease with chaperone function [Polaromonas sp. CG_9.11]|nr:Zn-dependent protease with chaperone function [Polaromonas sp. CG_9.11]